VVIADDHPLFSEALALILEAYGIAVVGRAADGAEAVALTRALRPDVVLMDVHMPTMNGIEATRRILRERHAVRVLVVSASTAPADVEAARRAGASAYLVKDCPPGELVREITAAAPVAATAA
jgi:DNA-binding NarL/FixJ family response regulator